MAKQIAVHLGSNGQTTAFDNPGMLTVFQKYQREWKKEKEMQLILDKSHGLAGLRSQMVEIIQFLGACKLFVAKEVAGIPFFTLEKAGCTVWEHEGMPAEFLDYILEKEEEQALLDAVQKDIHTYPVQMGEGRFSINLAEIQQSNSSVTSKQALQPFLRSGCFYELEVLCHHIPPWLEAELTQGNYRWASEKNSDLHRLLIYKNTCNQ